MHAPTSEETKRWALSRSRPARRGTGAGLTSLLALRRDPERRGQDRHPRAGRAHLAAARWPGKGSRDHARDSAERQPPLPRGALPGSRLARTPAPTSATPGPSPPAGAEDPSPGRPVLCLLGPDRRSRATLRLSADPARRSPPIPEGRGRGGRGGAGADLPRPPGRVGGGWGK